MEMEIGLLTGKKKLGIFEILKQAILIPCKNINFIFFQVITSFSLFCILVFYEILLQRTLYETSMILKQRPCYFNHCCWPIPSEITKKLNWEYTQKLIQLSLLYLLPLHLLELYSALMTVDLASKLYGKQESLTLKEMIQKPIQKERLTGTFITSLYVLFLSTCTLLGLIWLVINYFVFLRNYPVFDVFFAVIIGAAFVLLLTKYLEWTAMWNLSIVISVLEGIYGHEALALSAYYKRGSERRGLVLMLLFFVWGNGLRLPCLYSRCFEGGNGIIAQVSLFCIGNVIKWIACMLYFYDCKERIAEKNDCKERIAEKNDCKERIAEDKADEETGERDESAGK